MKPSAKQPAKLSTKQSNKSLVLISIALVVMLSTFIHSTFTDLSLFHGLVLHPVFLVFGLLLFTFVNQKHRGK